MSNTPIFIYAQKGQLIFLNIGEGLAQEQDLKKQGWELTSTISAETILSNIYDICNEEYEAEERIRDIIRLFRPEYDPHEASKVECGLCGHTWVAVRPKGLTELECPNCNNMTQFENID